MCNNKKPDSEYYLRKGIHRKICKICQSTYQKLHRSLNLEIIRAHDRERRYIYKTSFHHFINRMFTLMQMRVRGQGNMSKYYIGLPLCLRQEFYDFALKDKNLIKLYKQWQKNDYDHKLIPTPDRIINSKGYTIDNIQFLTLSENQQKRHLD
jgi:hypothetical protein